jgi:GT2 family glycosyltransferase
MIVIILVNYNNKKDTIECVNSIYKSENLDLPFIVLVDNNSTTKISNKELNFYPNIKIINSSSNIGFGRANNLGLSWALSNLKSDFVFFLNNDTIIKSDTLLNLIKYFPNDENIVMVSPKILTYEKIPRIWYGGGFFNFKRMSVNIQHITKPDLRLKSQYVDFASGCAMFFKTEYLKHNLAFDNEFFMYEEDLELCIRLSKTDKKIFFINDSIVYHKCQGSQLENTSKEINQLHPKYKNLKFYLSLTIHNRYYIINKHFKNFEKLKLKFNLTVYWFLKSAQYFLFKEFEISFLTLKLIFKNIKK